jgi:hypothetical protein
VRLCGGDQAAGRSSYGGADWSPSLKSTQPPVITGVERPGREADRWSVHGADIKSKWSCTSTPTVYVHGVDRDNSTFTITRDCNASSNAVLPCAILILRR